MGMYDESWCNGCGKSQPYSEDEEIYCGECATDYANENVNRFLEYVKLHLISLEQDSDKVNAAMDEIEDLDSDEYKDLEIEDISINGQIMATSHLLKIALDNLSQTV
jgi:hypothetical protein